MSKETRTVRPFVGLSAVENVLDETQLHFGQEPCSAQAGIIVDLAPHEYLLRPVSLEWGVDQQAFEAFKRQIAEGAQILHIPPDHLSLVVVASSPYLKKAQIVLELPCSDLDELVRVTELSAGARPTAFSAPFSGFRVDAYLLLNRTLPKQPLKPHLRGTWIAHTEYRIATTQGPALLPPTPLTREVRERYDLPSKAIRYLYLGDHDLLRPYSEQEQPVFYVDEDLLSQLNARRRSAASKALQLQLAQDFAAVVIRRAAANEDIKDVGYDDVRTSLLGSILRIAAGPGAQPNDMDRLVSEVRTNPDLVIARTEHFIDLGAGFGDLLEEDEA